MLKNQLKLKYPPPQSLKNFSVTPHLREIKQASFFPTRKHLKWKKFMNLRMKKKINPNSTKTLNKIKLKN